MSQSNITKEQFQAGEAREFAEARTEAKDYFISNNFPNNLKEYEIEKYKRVEELEKQFLLEGDTTLELANKFVHGELKNWNTCALKKELKVYKGDKNKKSLGKIGLMYKLNREYEGLTGTRHPCYDQYKNHVWVVASELEKEILDRKKGKLERRFAKEIDKCSAFGDVIRNGGLDDINNKDLEKLYTKHETRKKRVNLLVEDYLKHGGEGQGIFVIPNYNKYLHSSISILSYLDVELIFRNEDVLGEL